MPEIVGVTDLGSNNRGTISAADTAANGLRDELIGDAAKPEYRKKPTDCWRCVDGRLPEGGLRNDPETADPQGAGAEVTFESAIDYMLDEGSTEKLSEKAARRTREIIGEGREVKVHGDAKKGLGGCGAITLLCERTALSAIAENLDIIAPKAWALSDAVGITNFIEEDDITKLALTAKNNTENEELFDVTPEQFVKIAIENGATYEELQGPHNEKQIHADTSESAYDEEEFMKDHPVPGEDDKVYQAFVASIGVYKKVAFERALKEGLTERDASLRVLGFILFNIAVPKELTAEEQGNGEALPVVILK